MQSYIQLLQHERPLPPSTPRYRMSRGPPPFQAGKQLARDACEEFPALDARDDGRDLCLGTMLSYRMHLSISFRRSTPLQNRPLICGQWSPPTTCGWWWRVGFTQPVQGRSSPGARARASTPLRFVPSQGPVHSPTVGSKEEAISYEPGTPAI